MSPLSLLRSPAGAKDRTLAAWTLALALILAIAWAASAAAQPLGRCSSSGSDRSLCGRVAVPLDRTGQVPGSVSLRVRALPPKSGAPTATVLALAGGPGQAATPLLDKLAGALGPALDTRELVVFDQRGTGGSGRLSCRALSNEGTSATLVGRCAGELGPGRIAYTTAESVEDIEAVRAALGIDRLIVYGTSYGTRVALAYAAAHPEHVERLVLDSVVLPTGVDPFVRTSVASIPRVVRALCAGDCRFTRDPMRELVRLAGRLERRPLFGSRIDAHGHSRDAGMGGSDLLRILIVGDLDPALRAALPGAVHAALHGDATPLLRLAGRPAAGGVLGSALQRAHGDSLALFLATTCEDGGVPWAPGTPVERRRAAVNAAAAAIPSTAFAPFGRTAVRAVGNADLCRGWPEAPIVQPQPPLPSTPTLILSGDDDLRTPRSDAAKLAGQLPGAQLLEVPDAGHSVLGADPTDCAERAVSAFLDGMIPGHCRAHPRALPTIPPPPRSLAALRRLHGQPAQVGRTITAVVLTLEDVAYQLIELAKSGGDSGLSFGGLRAGSARLDVRTGGVRLHGYAYVPGVTVTGIVSTRANAITLTIGGRAAARGRLTISVKRVGGTLGGHRVRLDPAKLGKATAAAAAAGRSASTGPLPALALP